MTVRQNQPVAGLAPSGGNLIMALGARDPATLDPALVGDATSAFVTQQLFSGLVRLDENLAIQPGIAERWTVSDDGMTYTFTLRANARFADDTPITSEDVRYSLERATDPGLAATLPARVYLNDIVGVAEKLDGTATSISGIQVIDPQTLAITIVGPRSYFLAKLSHPTAFVVDRRTEEADPAGWTEQPNGSGPFMIEEWRHDQRLVLRRNPNYYGDLARLDRVTMLMGAAASNPLVLYETGAIDFTSVPAYALDRVRDESNPLSRELVSVPQLSLSYIGMNVNRAPFDDVNVRQAFTLLIDQARLANVTLSGGVQAARGILPPGMPGYNEQLPDPQVDLKRARQLLRESSYGGAEQLPPIVGYGGGWVGLLRDLAEEELGVMIEVRAYENFGDYLDALDEAQFALFDIGWVADYPDPQNFLDVLFHSGSQENYSAYASPEVDALLDQAASEADEMTRWQLYQEAERQILADAPIIPLYHNIDYVLIKPYVHGLNVTPMGILDLSTAELIR